MRWKIAAGGRLAKLGMMFLAMGAIGLAGCQTNKDEGVVLKFQAAHAAGLTLRWQSAVGLDNDKIVDMWRVEDTVFVGTEKGLLYSIDASSGRINWEVPPDLGQTTILKRPAFVQGGAEVLEVGEGEAFLVNTKTGEVDKRRRLTFSPASDPVVVGNLFLIGDLNDYFHAIYVDILGGEPWRVLSEKDSYMARPVLVDKKTAVIFASKNGIVSKRTIADGMPGWDRKVNGEVVANLAADQHAVYVASLNYQVFAFDLLTGNLIFSKRLDGKLDHAPVPVNGIVLVASGGKGLYAVLNDERSYKWLVPGVTRVVAVAPSTNTAYARDTAGNLLVLNLDTGDITGSVPCKNVAIFGDNQVDSTIYMATVDGRVAAFDPPK